MVSIARKNLFEDLPRFIVAEAGIILSVCLVTIQTGLFQGFTRSTALTIDRSSADIWVGSQEMANLELTKPLLYEQVQQARQVEGVALAEPLIVGTTKMSTPGGEINTLRVFGFDPEGKLFSPNSPGNIIRGSLKDLKQPLTIMVDESNLGTFNLQKIGDRAEISSLPVRLVAITEDTQSIVSSKFLFTSLENAKAYFNSGLTSSVNCKVVNDDVQCTTSFQEVKPDNTSKAVQPLAGNDPIAYVLIKAKPGQDLQALKQRLDKALPSTRAYLKQEIAQKTRSFWLKRTGVGFILGLGAAVGIFVGMAIVGQILYSSVSDHLKEFGTLKAMGASNSVIYGVIVEQALWMSVLGYIPGMLICLALSSWTLTTKGITILITPLTATGVFGITVLMCVGSALFAIQKVVRLDPGIVFKA
jgi:putative ABC transport system permease protein